MAVQIHDPGAPPADSGGLRRHVLSIAVEDYFQAGAFSQLISSRHWHRFDHRIEANTHRALDLLDRHGVKATFFALGWVAEHMPHVLREIVARGHEVASKGYLHRSLQDMTLQEFRHDARKSRDIIEQATGQRVLGYRVARGHIGPQDLWALDVLAEEDYVYDSSFYPRGRSLGGEGWRSSEFDHFSEGLHIHEFPLATWSLAGWRVPIAGGAYLRHIPHRLISRAVAARVRQDDSPLVMYFHVWELDDALPRITAAPGHAQIRQYRNIDKMPWRLNYYLKRYAFESFRDHLGLDAEPATAHARAPGAPLPATALPAEAAPQREGPRTEVTVVIPCFNEEGVLPYLRNTLDHMASEFRHDYDMRFLFVDDGSSDGTWAALQQMFGDRADCTLVQHERNQGVAQAILTGVKAAPTEVVCSIDCDCTYDPMQLREFIPRLTDDVAMVTASPYHPEGRVANVPPWRLFLSKGLSFLYRRVFRHKFYTYTSCFRVYRRSRMHDMQLRETGFLGVAEMVALLDRRGDRIVEQPAVLEVRLLGQSKMKLLRTIRGHLRLIWRLLIERAGQPGQPPARPRTQP